MKPTVKNKLYALGMTAIGILTAMIEPHDATALVLILCISIPMFFSKKPWIY